MPILRPAPFCSRSTVAGAVAAAALGGSRGASVPTLTPARRRSISGGDEAAETAAVGRGALRDQNRGEVWGGVWGEWGADETREGAREGAWEERAEAQFEAEARARSSLGRAVSEPLPAV